MTYLADTSAAVKIIARRALPDWYDLATSGHIAICSPVECELVKIARDLPSYQNLQGYLRTTFTWVPVPDNVWSLVAEIQHDLVRIGHHRGPSMPDLLVAATAIEHDLTVLHLDLDFESIKKVVSIETTRIDEAPPS